MIGYMLVRHKVRDFAQWKRVYDAHLPHRVVAGLTEKQLLRGARDANEIFVLFEAENIERAQAFTEAADLRETMAKAGVLDKPDIYFLTG